MNYRSILTEAELQDLNKVHMGAMDYIRKAAAVRDAKVPCWLCMNAEAKKEAVEKFAEFLEVQTGQRMDPLGLMMLCNQLPDELLDNWRMMEAELKQARADHNPAAFFC